MFIWIKDIFVKYRFITHECNWEIIAGLDFDNCEMVIFFERSEILVHKRNENIFGKRVSEIPVGSFTPIINIIIFYFTILYQWQLWPIDFQSIFGWLLRWFLLFKEYSVCRVSRILVPPFLNLNIWYAWSICFLRIPTHTTTLQSSKPKSNIFRKPHLSPKQ